ncbi:uncharacterized protein H6S33_005814 [Morchella sextelata]|uniref:uncharacterized protein n=1 Tax=Morchella sextelata TaxID=1174677 RepID=UPI001D043A53|nr:uncharacterized protein H6S33_005814 [Morchella sextelata]KAH0613928.1 hypothetical protein H6S33_005814 [Morchella sextelata]
MEKAVFWPLFLGRKHFEDSLRNPAAAPPVQDTFGGCSCETPKHVDDSGCPIRRNLTTSVASKGHPLPRINRILIKAWTLKLGGLARNIYF